ncbi:class 1 fructose-bisphosphatase [Klebsiella pneumoniae]|uniref:class 1 fructose-bisphosphatase n=1 Tax=Klebsiella pneumoniae TaxID=573 RepID=UPI001084351D|nr:class 1 fructose-bisphosphatase [Klebsiella pneumoniae]MDD1906307.1 class 1 fructose-bisphosphatase [Klebsiella pneumoniae]MDD1911601.1 class 1 fructose-bisphosphatase [Klebsiella pneumoniae]MDP0740042.1 class 1 fructose-bisphosphatase [Klebsiella pneumoniae]VGD66224.1 Fructose-1,6-bisphosphatase [Klebsiella pneumoniae]HBR5009484.1 class 1 fructose-bisphosphatase [Klebsiella pneumoniae]
MKTLSDFFSEKNIESTHQESLASVITSFSIAGKLINNYISIKGLLRGIDDPVSLNVHNEEQTDLDIFANAKVHAVLALNKHVAGIVSEEDDSLVLFNDEQACNGDFIVLFDPLDGSSNIDVNVSVGTVFSVYKRTTETGIPVEEKDFLQPGRNQVAAGYLIYGSSTILVFSTGHGVQAFTYDNGVGEFICSHSGLELPDNGCQYSVNEGNYEGFSAGIKSYIADCRKDDPTTGRPYSSRYVGSLVADFHRCLFKGGIYLYPATQKHPSGKLRLLYECNPIAFLAEQAGGMSVTEQHNVLDIIPTEIHQRSPFITGSSRMVQDATLSFSLNR